MSIISQCLRVKTGLGQSSKASSEFGSGRRTAVGMSDATLKIQKVNFNKKLKFIFKHHIEDMFVFLNKKEW